MQQKRILVIGVIYNTYPETLRYLRSIPFAAGSVNVILADNSSTPQPPGFMETVNAMPGLAYFHTGANLGYLHGAGMALNNYLDNDGIIPDWILVTNVDIEFSANFFNRLAALEQDHATGLIAPAIISEQWGCDYNPQRMVPYSKVKLKFLRMVCSSYMIHNLYLAAAYFRKWLSGKGGTRGKKRPGQPEPGTKIYAAHGSCLIFSKTYFEFGGTLDMTNFLFGEEVYIAESARKLGLSVVYQPGLVIRDHEHASTGFFVTRETNRHYRDSIKTILKNYYR